LKLADIKSHGAEAGRHKGNGEIVTSEDWGVAMGQESRDQQLRRLNWRLRQCLGRAKKAGFVLGLAGCRLSVHLYSQCNARAWVFTTLASVNWRRTGTMHILSFNFSAILWSSLKKKSIKTLISTNVKFRGNRWNNDSTLCRW
jgi:hypothetical protein